MDSAFINNHKITFISSDNPATHQEEKLNIEYIEAVLCVGALEPENKEMGKGRENCVNFSEEERRELQLLCPKSGTIFGQNLKQTYKQMLRNNHDKQIYKTSEEENHFIQTDIH